VSARCRRLDCSVVRPFGWQAVVFALQRSSAQQDPLNPQPHHPTPPRPTLPRPPKTPSYYPKLQSCVPFTPVSGPRLMVPPSPLRPAILKALAETLVSITDQLGVSSLHITFSSAEEWGALGALGLQQRRGIQFHWENDGYGCFDDFLAALKQSKRKSIRQVRCGCGVGVGFGVQVLCLCAVEMGSAVC